MTPLRFGILGNAKINDRLGPAFKAAAGVELRAVASRSADSARAAAAELGVPVAHAGYEALLDDPDVDAVYVPLPNSLHAEWTRAAADRGKHVLCEKPLTPTAPEAAELVAYCRSKGVRLMDGFMWPHHPRTAKIRRLIDSGGIGPVRRVVSAFTFLLDDLTTNNIRLHRPLGGGGLLDVGCYCVYGIRWAFGAEPVRAAATADFVNDVDVSMAGTVWLADGRVGTFDTGFTEPFRGWLEIVGTTGVVRVNDMWVPDGRAAFEVHREGRPVEVVTTEGYDQIVCMLEDFAAAVREGREPAPSPDEAVKTLRVLDALDRSARDGGRPADVTP